MPDDDAPLPVEGDEDLNPILVETGDAAAAETASKIQAFGAHAGGGQQQHQFKRELNLTGAGATRVRVFHAKITVASLDHLAEMINDWLDSNQIEIKSVAQVVGVMEGKKPEPNIIITVWY